MLIIEKYYEGTCKTRRSVFGRLAPEGHLHMSLVITAFTTNLLSNYDLNSPLMPKYVLNVDGIHLAASDFFC